MIDMAILLLASNGLGAEPAPADRPVLLPDGTAFGTWEVPLKFSKTYHVDGAGGRASDDGPGTKDRPFRTINRAAEVLQPGQRVVVAGGTYRERVSPARGGTGPDSMISYEAAPGAEVVIKGSRVLRAKWEPARKGGGDTPAVWKVKLPADLFSEENPFRQVNLTDEDIDRAMPWAKSMRGKLPCTLRRGLVFQDSQRLVQVADRAELGKHAGTYWVAPDGVTIHCRPIGDADPNEACFEVTTRGFVFAPESFGLGYIRVRGLTIEHSGNCFPRPQAGALSTRRGHHWIIEGNTVRQCNAIGIDVGDQFDVTGPRLAEGGRHVVRGNTVTDCGIGGIEGKAIEHTLIEGNVVRRCGWQRALKIWETGGIKVHCTRSTLVRGNLVTDTVQATGIWMDYANVNSRCTRNVIVNVDSPVHGGIFMEASQEPNLVDHNVVWQTTAHGICQAECDELSIAHNFVAHARRAAIHMTCNRRRKVCGRLATAKRNTIVNNVAVACGAMFSFSDPENRSDYNVFSPGDRPFDLAAWQQQGWDAASVTADIQASLDPQTLELTWSAKDKLPQCPRVEGVTCDFWYRPRRGKTVTPGPFGPPPARPTRIRLFTPPGTGT